MYICAHLATTEQLVIKSTVDYAYLLPDELRWSDIYIYIYRESASFIHRAIWDSPPQLDMLTVTTVIVR